MEEECEGMGSMRGGEYEWRGSMRRGGVGGEWEYEERGSTRGWGV